MRTALRTALSNGRKWTVYEAADGREAVIVASEVKPDVIVLDLTMPVLNGFAAAIAIRRTTPSVPIILSTVHDAELVEREGTKAGISKVVTKAHGVEVLLKTIEELLT